MIKPALVVHADWGSAPRKRWMAWAQLGADDRYCVLAPNPVGDLATLFQRLRAAAGTEGCVLLGVDFPIGLPLHYAELAGIGTFLDALPRFGEGRWERFYEVSGAPQDISIVQPFYPARPGGARREHLLAALQADSFDALRRRCELPHPGRRAAAPLFWTLGGQQVGKAAIIGWRDLLGPALRGGRDNLAIWPFSGPLAALCVPGRIVVAESYPAEFYGHLGISFTQGCGEGRRGGKRVREARRANAPLLLQWARQAGVDVAPDLADMIRDGFGAGPDGEDLFDAVIGLFGMLNVVLGRQPPGEVQDARLRMVEGWILGQAVS